MAQKIAAFFQKDTYAALTGIKLLDVSEGHAKAMLEITENHLNSAGMVHGGVIFTLADFAFEVASNSYGTLALAINAQISFFKAVSAGVLYAEANEVSRHPKLASYSIDVTNETGDLIASFQGMVYRKKDLLKIE
ncbi:MAG: hotdog fold thioesterase [Methanophagales archaeon ANME-1-THS]|nr:MAG: hotdog fold thioesterase [Methanophagales archaeon ANME-1-THS]